MRVRSLTVAARARCVGGRNDKTDVISDVITSTTIITSETDERKQILHVKKNTHNNAASLKTGLGTRHRRRKHAEVYRRKIFTFQLFEIQRLNQF